jgi:hypothetical protein
VGGGGWRSPRGSRGGREGGRRLDVGFGLRERSVLGLRNCWAISQVWTLILKYRTFWAEI